MRVLLLTTLLVCYAAAQAPPSPAAFPGALPGDPDPARLEGSVISTTGEPIPRAQLRLISPGVSANGSPATYTSTSDDAGHFVFESLPPARKYLLSAERPGYANAPSGASGPSMIPSPITLEAGQVLKDVTVTLIPQGVIAGTVTNQDGDPVVGAQVEAMISRDVGGRRQLARMERSTTNDLGEYRLANLVPGEYYVSAMNRRVLPPGSITRPSGDEPEETDILTYFPSSPDSLGAAPINVTAGAAIQAIDIRLLRERTYSITGTAVDRSTDAPVANVALSATPMDPFGPRPSSPLDSPQITRPPDGAFQFRGLRPGTYTLQKANVTRNGEQLGTGLFGRMEVTITDDDISGVVFALGPGATISGALTLDDGDIRTVLAGAGAVSPGFGGIVTAGQVVNLMEVSGMANSIGALGPVQPDGSFQVSGLPPGRFSVRVGGLPEGTYVKRIRYGGQDVTRSVLDLTSGIGGTLDILISNQPAEVIGVVRNSDGETVAGAFVTVWSKQRDANSPTGGVQGDITDQNGRFQIRRLAPGKYYLAAWEPAGPGFVPLYEFVNQFTSDAVEVELSEGAHAEHQLEPVPRAKIEAALAKLP